MGQEGRERRGERLSAGVALACAWLRVLKTAPYGRDGKRDNGPEGLLRPQSELQCVPLSRVGRDTSHVYMYMHMYNMHMYMCMHMYSTGKGDL